MKKKGELEERRCTESACEILKYCSYAPAPRVLLMKDLYVQWCVGIREEMGVCCSIE